MKIRVRFPPYSKEVVEEFFSSFTKKMVNISGDNWVECWIWNEEKRDRKNRLRSIITVNGKENPGRVSYQIHVGDIPPGVQVRRLCGRVGCVNPDHLRIRQDKP